MATLFQRQAQRYPGLARRARRRARRELEGERRRTEREVARVRRQGARAASNVQQTGARVAGDFRAEARNLRGVATPNLVRRQLQAQAGQYARFGQGLAAIAGRQARSAERDLRMDFRQTRRTRTQELLGSMIQGRRAEVSGREQALRRASEFLNQIPPPQRERVLSNPMTWLRLERQIAGAEGVSPAVARSVVSEVARRVQQQIGQQQPIPPASAMIGPTGVPQLGRTEYVRRRRRDRTFGIPPELRITLRDILLGR